MTGRIDARLKELGVTLPSPMAPIANWVRYIVAGNLVSISGQGPAEGDTLSRKLSRMTWCPERHGRRPVATLRYPCAAFHRAVTPPPDASSGLASARPDALGSGAVFQRTGCVRQLRTPRSSRPEWFSRGLDLGRGRGLRRDSV